MAGVQAEVTEPFKLIPQLRLRVFQTRLALRRHDFEGARIEMLLEIAGGVGFGHGEQPVVEAHLGFNRLRGADPVNGSFDFTPGIGAPALAVEVGGAV